MERREWAGLSLPVWIAIVVASVILQAASYHPQSPFKPLEAFGFISNAIGVLLVVKDNVWNWPIGIVGSGLSVILFVEQKLWGDSGLNGLYVVLGIVGWWAWLRGGENRGELPMGAGGGKAILYGIIAGVLMTAGFTAYFQHIHDSAPFLDGLTTAFSLVAQVLLTRRLIENWIFWIFVDIVYVPLYVSRHLVLYAILYAGFLALAIWGYLSWRKTLGRTVGPDPVP